MPKMSESMVIKFPAAVVKRQPAVTKDSVRKSPGGGAHSAARPVLAVFEVDHFWTPPWLLLKIEEESLSAIALLWPRGSPAEAVDTQFRPKVGIQRQ